MRFRSPSAQSLPASVKPTVLWSLWTSAAFLAALLLVGGCGKGHFGDEAAAAQSNTFRVSLNANPTTLDPAIVQDVDTGGLMDQVFEGLVKWGTDNKLHPALAESWDVKKSGTVYIFHLRKDVKFFNGDVMSAADVKFSFDRACTPSVKSTTASNYLSSIVGVDDALAGKVKGVSGVKVIDPQTIELDLVKPAYYFLGDLAMPVADIVDSKVVPATSQITSTDKMMGTGPFMPSKYIEDQSFALKSNPDYWQGKPSIDGVLYAIVKDEQTRLNMFEQGQLDFSSASRQNAVVMKQNPKYSSDLHLDPRPATSYVAFNEKVYPPFANVHVRRAFCMAINQVELCKQVLGGLNQPATGILPPGVAGFRPDAKCIPFDPAGAKKELAEAGYSDGSKLPPLKLFVRSDQEDSKLVGEAVQSYLKKNLDVSVSLTTMDWTTYLQQMNARLVPMYYVSWYADYLDPQDFLNLLFITNGPENRQYYSNPKVDALCKAAAPMPTDDPTRLKMYAEAEDIILQEAAWKPIFFATDINLINPRVSGLQQSTMGYLPFNTVTIKH